MCDKKMDTTELKATLTFKWALKRLIGEGWQYSGAIFVASAAANKVREAAR